MQQTWRIYLAHVAKTPKERQELAKKIGVTARTLDRWITGEAKNPQEYLLQKLLEVLPAQRSHLVTLLKEEFPAFEPSLLPTDEAVKEIPIAFYARVLETNAQIADPLHFWTMTSLILQQMMYQLDPKKQGLHLTIVSCLPPADQTGHVRSLVETVEQGTPPWKTTTSSMRGPFLGAESLAGYVVAAGKPAWIQDIAAEAHLFPVRREPYEVSAAAYPIARKGLVAGCLIAASTQRDFFSDVKLQLMYHYTQMLVLAFDPEAFYPRERIRLHTGSQTAEQTALFARFSQRLVLLSRIHPHLSQQQRELLVYQELEQQWIAEET